MKQTKKQPLPKWLQLSDSELLLASAFMFVMPAKDALSFMNELFESANLLKAFSMLFRAGLRADFHEAYKEYEAEYPQFTRAQIRWKR